MEKMNFKVGDIVRLKSGGPSMTVKGYRMSLINKEEEMICQWFSGDKLQTGVFNPDSVEEEES